MTLTALMSHNPPSLKPPRRSPPRPLPALEIWKNVIATKQCWNNMQINNFLIDNQTLSSITHTLKCLTPSAGDDDDSLESSLNVKDVHHVQEELNTFCQHEEESSHKEKMEQSGYSDANLLRLESVLPFQVTFVSYYTITYATLFSIYTCLDNNNNLIIKHWKDFHPIVCSKC